VALDGFVWGCPSGVCCTCSCNPHAVGPLPALVLRWKLCFFDERQSFCMAPA
jgi:hypothetical protein